MVKYRTDPLSSTFAALADPTRRAILARLCHGGTTVGTLAEPFEISLPAVSKHLRVLEGAGLIKVEKQGRIRQCRVEAAPLRAASEWIEEYRRFWEAALDSLARYLEDEAGRTTTEGGNGDGQSQNGK